jgi:hypothetical protein
VEIGSVLEGRSTELFVVRTLRLCAIAYTPIRIAQLVDATRDRKARRARLTLHVGPDAQGQTSMPVFGAKAAHHTRLAAPTTIADPAPQVALSAGTGAAAARRKDLEDATDDKRQRAKRCGKECTSQRRAHGRSQAAWHGRETRRGGTLGLRHDGHDVGGAGRHIHVREGGSKEQQGERDRQVWGDGR